jgi:flagellar biosynthesis protein FliR
VIELLIAGMFVFSRLAGLFMTLPGIGGQGVPTIARMGFALPLTIVLLPAHGPAEVPASVIGLLGGVTVEALVGIATGTVVTMVFGALGMAADIIGGQMGLQAAAMLDPVSGMANGAMGSLATWLATGLFFGSDQHLRCVVALGQSFDTLPANSAEHAWRAGAIVFEVATATLVTGVQLAGPLVLFVSMVNLGLALLGRMAPNLNLFFGIGHTLTLLAGFVLVAFAWPALFEAWSVFVESEGFGRLGELWHVLD